MSSAGLIEIVASQGSPQINALQKLSGLDTVSLWSVSYRSVTNFSLEHNECTLSSSPSGTAAGQRLIFRVSKAGDLMTSAWLEVRCPQLCLQGETTGSKKGVATYVHAVGYAMLQSVSFTVSNHSQEDVPGIWHNIAEELHTPAGRRVTSAVFKHDRITLPEMDKLSRQGMTLMVPLRLFFTTGVASNLPLASLSCHDLDIIVTLRALNDCVIGLTAGGNGVDTLAVCKGPLDDSTAKTASDALKWDDFTFRLWAGQVYLDSAERQSVATRDHSILMKTVHTYTSHTQDEGYPVPNDGSITLQNLPFNHPISSLVWVIGDKERRASSAGTRTVGTGSDIVGKPYTAGVRALYGEVATVTSGGTWDNAHADYNVIREGAVSLGTVGDVKVLSSAGVKEHRSDRQNGSLHLPGDIFDFRTADTSGNEIEPLVSASLQLNNQERWDTNLAPSYFNLVQPALHFQNVPAKGIYAYSFAQNASSQFPNGTINASRIDDKTLRLTAPKYSDGSNGSSVSKEAYIFAEYFQIFQSKKNSVGKLFGN